MIFHKHFKIRQDAKSVGCLCCLLMSNYEELNLNLSKRRQLLVDGDVESNPGPSQKYYKSPCRRPKKIKVFRGKSKKIDLVSNNVKVDSSVIRDETAALGLTDNRENVSLTLLCRCYIHYHCLGIKLTNYNLQKE